MHTEHTTHEPAPKLCECGCGELANPGKRFIHGHNTRKLDLIPPNPSGLCMCGCGEKTPIAKETDLTWNRVAGHPVRFFNNAHARRRPITERFFEKVDRSGGPDSCWIWKAAKGAKGYGRFSVKGQIDKAHRVSWEIHFGPIPAGMCVLHNCPTGDNPSCVNPAHLWLGTVAENTHDMIEKGRDKHLTDEDHGGAKFTNVQVVELRRQHFELGIGTVELARRHHVSRSTMGRILHSKTYKHI